jgi:membrane fusion protein (multidrug efflux system)
MMSNTPFKQLPFHMLVIYFFLSCVTIAVAQKPTEVIVGEARIEQLYDRVEVLGTLRANESVDITATVTDTVTVIHFEDGQRLNRGDILIEMTSEEEHAQLEEELSTFSEAEKQYNRLTPLVARGAASKSLLDQRQRELSTAKARLRAIESRLQDRLILAPFSGVVGLKNISVGALVEPGDVITTLDDDTTMKLDFTVPAIHLAALKRGIPIKARSSAYAGREFEGTIMSIGSRIDSVTRSITVRALIDNQERLLKPGLLMTAELLKNKRDAIVIQEEALIPSGKTNFVLVVDASVSPQKAVRREVQIGVRRFGEVEIVQGLKAGELVITHGAMRVRPGQELTILSVDTGDQPLETLLSGKKEGAAQ